MSPHASERALLDLALGEGKRADRDHASACAECASHLAELRQGLALARKADVPEPPPLYWEALRRDVSRRIAEEPRPLAGWNRFAALASAAAVLAILFSSGRATRRPVDAPAPVLPSWSALPPTEEDPGLVVLEGLVRSDGDLTAWEEGRSLGAFLADLSEADGRALADTLRGGIEEGDL
jgi:hypothetical protein